jgi:ATP-dependent helicase HrpB
MKLEALDAEGRITAVGRRLRSLPLPPRLARMTLAAAELGHAEEAAEIAAVIVERGLGGNDADLAQRLEGLHRDRGRRASDMRRLAATWARAATAGRLRKAPRQELSLARLLALAFPERIGKARGTPGQFLLANGRGANLDASHALARSPFLVAAELSGPAASTRVLLAAAADEADVLAAAGHRLSEGDEIEFDFNAAALRARRVRRLDAITLASEPRAVVADAESARLLALGIAKLGLGRLPWSKAQNQLRDRVGFLRAAGEDEWPDLSDVALGGTVAAWLAPFLAGKTKLSEIGSDDLGAALAALLPWHLQRRLETEAPTHFEAPTGNRHAIDYETAGAPALHIRVQELFGLRRHPSIANGKLPLTLHLLSPAHRPLQITRDLPGFWKGSWAAVKAEMKGRYPRHPWPEDPASAAPTARAKPRGT